MSSSYGGGCTGRVGLKFEVIINGCKRMQERLTVLIDWMNQFSCQIAAICNY